MSGRAVAPHVRVHLGEALLDVGLGAALPHGAEVEALGRVVQLRARDPAAVSAHPRSAAAPASARPPQGPYGWGAEPASLAPQPSLCQEPPRRDDQWAPLTPRHPEQPPSPRRCWCACWRPAPVALKLRGLRQVPGISFQPLNEDLIQFGGPGKEIKGNSYRPDPLTHMKAEAMAQTASASAGSLSWR